MGEPHDAAEKADIVVLAREARDVHRWLRSLHIGTYSKHGRLTLLQRIETLLEYHDVDVEPW